MKGKIMKIFFIIGVIISGYKMLYAPDELKKEKKEDVQIQGVEPTRGWEEDGINLWTAVSPLPLYNVGIGTSSPTSKLDVSGKISADYIKVRKDAQTGYILVSQNNSGDAIWNDPVYTVFKIVKKTSDQTTQSTSLIDVDEMSFNVEANKYYFYEFYVVYRSSNANNGISLAVSFPSSIISSYRVGIPQKADGVDAERIGWGTYSDDAVTTTDTPSANTDHLAYIKGIIIPSVNGVLKLRFASETGAENVTIRRGSIGRMISY